MKNKKVLQKLLFFKTIFADLIYLCSADKMVIDKDVERYLEQTPYKEPGIGALNYCLIFYKPFRNIFYYRTKSQRVLRGLSRMVLAPIETIEITGGVIEAGLRIDHNFCVVRPYRAGKNLTVRNGVTIGKGKPSTIDEEIVNPILGDDVDIYANAVIFGGIRIGNRVKVGAGAVVNKDVPDDCTVVGNPMRIIHR